MSRLQVQPSAALARLFGLSTITTRTGVAARLIVAFLAVVVLVLAANLLVVRTVLVEKSTTIYQPVAVPEHRAPLHEHVAPVRRVDTSTVREAVLRYRSSARARIASQGEQAATDLSAAIANLQQALDAFAARTAAIGKSAEGSQLSAHIGALRTDTDNAITVADERRASIQQYVALVDELNTQATQSLQSSWKIFGVIIARQRLVQYDAALDQLRHAAATLGESGSRTADDLHHIEQPESKAQKALESNASEFRRALGRPWYDAAHEEFAQLAKLRGEAIQLTDTLETRLKHNFELGDDLYTSIPTQILEAAAPAVVHHDEPPAEPLERPVAPAPLTTQSVTYQRGDDHHRQTWIALISTGVIVLLIVIGVGTVLSIEIPVRRLLEATARIARGDQSVRVQRGGIKELDRLAVAFNSMADELQQARAVALEYQQSLEMKVEARTRDLRNYAENDYLTGLPNRRLFLAILNDSLIKARERGQIVGIFFLDVDNFKYINDSLGHAFGDRVLLGLARRLSETTRGLGVAARFGGDEFTVMLEGVASIEDVRCMGQRIVEAFRTPLSIDGRELIVGVSVGASVYPEHEREAESLLKAADAALFRAKKLGRSQLAVYTSDLLETAASKFATEQGLRRAIERGEFDLLFQPEVDTQSLETKAVEALIRWRTHDGQVILPGDFLSVAEESGLIVQISDWVLGSAIRSAARWHHGSWPEVRVAINISPRQLLDPGFTTRLDHLLQQADLPARCIEIELTESVLQTGPTTLEALRQLQARGIAIALDDFGTGYSSLSSLQQLPLSRVKLDRSLIADMDVNSRSRSMVRAIIGMCLQLDLDITAEGVERAEQFVLLSSHRGLYAQGYLLAEPVPEHELDRVRARITSRAEEFLLTTKTGSHRVVHELSATRRDRLLKPS